MWNSVGCDKWKWEAGSAKWGAILWINVEKWEVAEDINPEDSSCDVRNRDEEFIL